MAWCAVDCAVFANNILLVSRSFMTIFSECVLLLCAEHKQAECRAHFAWKVKLYFIEKNCSSLDIGSLLTGYRVLTHWISSGIHCVSV